MKTNHRNQKEEMMGGYFKPKPKETMKELHLLELDEIDYVSEDDEEESSSRPLRSAGRLHTCPRCKTITRIETHDPYCPDCNWDSLSDFSNGKNRCAA